ncbi:MAG: J domain-containing protein [Burkholderiaceae bacterium]|nr:J domain-containing protein [Burkholderiaceae bacterium]
MPLNRPIESQPLQPLNNKTSTSTTDLLNALSAVEQDTAPDSLEQAEFDLLIEQGKTLAAKLETLKVLVEQHRILYNNTIPVLQKKQDSLRRAMVLWLDQRLKGDDLTARQERLMRRLICSIGMEFALAGDRVMRALHDVHSEESLADIERAQAAEAHAYLKEAMGEEFGEDKVFENLDDVLHAKFDFMRKEAEARARNREAKRAKKKRMSPADLQAAEDVESALRSLYRKLASALHPDRESDEEVRAYKTKLMSEANTAYERRDLLALLELQTKAQLPAATLTSALLRKKLAALTNLMRERLTALHREIRDHELQATAEFVLPASMMIHEASLKHHLNSRKREMLLELRRLNEELTSVKTDAGLKRWLKEQTAD